MVATTSVPSGSKKVEILDKDFSYLGPKGQQDRSQQGRGQHPAPLLNLCSCGCTSGGFPGSFSHRKICGFGAVSDYSGSICFCEVYACQQVPLLLATCRPTGNGSSVLNFFAFFLIKVKCWCFQALCEEECSQAASNRHGALLELPIIVALQLLMLWQPNNLISAYQEVSWRATRQVSARASSHAKCSFKGQPLYATLTAGGIWGERNCTFPRPALAKRSSAFLTVDGLVAAAAASGAGEGVWTATGRAERGRAWPGLGGSRFPHHVFMKESVLFGV